MSINITNIIAALEAKVAAATSSTQTEELIVLLKTIKAANQETVVSYATVAALPVASTDNVGALAYVEADQKIYFSNGTAWTAVGTGSSQSGGGEAYDQSLNTTDDVVFNSALISDVSIIGNEISGTDVYGNSLGLVLNSPVEFKAPVEETSQAFLPFGVNMTVGMSGIQLGNFNGAYQQEIQTLLTLPANTVITTTDILDIYSYNSVKFRFAIATISTTPDFYNPGQINSLTIQPVNGNIEISVNNGAWVSTSIYANNYQGTTQPGILTFYYDSMVSVDRTIVSVDASGLTVNDVSFDQTLEFKTTVTESTLGNVTFDNIIFEYNSQGIRLTNISGYQTESQTLSRLPAGTLVTTSQFFNIFTYNNTSLRFRIGSISVQSSFYNPSEIVAIYITPEGNNIEVSTDGGASWTLYSIFAVNGQSGSGAKTFTYGSSSTVVKTVTTLSSEGVIAESALIGDVSIAGNTIAGVDSYGNADVLVLDGTVQFGGITSELPVITGAAKKWLKIEAVTPELIASTTQFVEGENFQSASITDMNPGVEISINGATFAPTIWTALTPGSTIEVLLPADGWYSVTLTTPGFDFGTGSYTAQLSGFPGTYSSANSPLSVIGVRISTTTEGTNLVPQTYYLPLYQ